MSHVTQCPKCSTHFRVVDDQLKISDGWVRCGQCGEVFDARWSMQPWPVVSVVQAEPTAPDPATDSENGVVVSRPLDQDGVLAEAEGIVLVSQNEAISGPEPQNAVGVDAVLAPDTSPLPETDAETLPERGHVPAPDVAFVRQAKRRAAWQQPWVKALLVLFVVTLGLLLVFQVLLHQRHRLAATYPDAVPGLQALCEALGCALEPHRQIESVLIDSSALVRERGGQFRLEVGLRNTSALTLAVPAVELSLTNTADEVVLRRVLMPTEWDVPPDALAPQNTELLSVRLVLEGAGELRMAGYRVLVFYP